MNSLEKVTEVTLYDPESDHCYNVFLNKEDAVRCETGRNSLIVHTCRRLLLYILQMQYSFNHCYFMQVAHSTPTTSANIANVNSTNNEEIVQESQNCEQGNIASGSSCNDESQKKKRFRFSEADRIKCIRELHGILAEDDLQNEENVWSRLNDTLMYDNPDRFNTCSLRLLKDHMLEQVLKFRKYDSKEATESGKERLQTPWGNYMRQLMLVWDNYEKLGERAVKVAEKARLETELQKEELKLKQQQHADNLRLQEETLQFQKSKLEFERERWHVEAQHRQAETARTNLLINIMQTLINKHNQ
ncbi:hypothetical protein FQA39_LY18322 [Lamprigera yunnana]|nr:hypothetical protein FQA39_LY18322 [Lamprigera yunnana]